MPRKMIPCACCGMAFKPWQNNQKYCSARCRHVMGSAFDRARKRMGRIDANNRAYAEGIDALVAAAQAAWCDINPCAGDNENMIYGNMVTL